MPGYEWVARHTWQSWRERYKNNEYDFDVAIRNYQKKHEIAVPEKNARIDSSQFTKSVVPSYGKKPEKNVEDRQQEKMQHPVSSGAARKTASMKETEVKVLDSGQKRKAVAEQEGEKSAKDIKRRRVEHTLPLPSKNENSERSTQHLAGNAQSAPKPLTVDRGVSTRISEKTNSHVCSLSLPSREGLY